VLTYYGRLFGDLGKTPTWQAIFGSESVLLIFFPISPMTLYLFTYQSEVPMPLYQLLFLALVQGVTEFLPVSSSGHLILLPQLIGTQDQGILLDVAVHIGTLGAVIVYFWSDVLRALRGIGHVLRGNLSTTDSQLALGLAIATVPVVIVGLILKVTGLIDHMRSITVIGWTMLGFGLVLYWADRWGSQTKKDQDWSLKHALIFGLWQAIALIPGTSRSGACITGARFLGYSRASAARISMLMSIPTILASGALLSRDVVLTNDPALLRDIGLAMVMSFGAALVALTLMMRLLKSVSFTPYVVYRAGLGVILLAIAYA
jgi:undecaprenyl-diphosphatase